MNHTIKAVTANRFHYQSRDQLRTHLADFMEAHHFATRLMALAGVCRD